MTTERRKNHRIQWHAWAMISACDGDWSSPCVLSDFSNGGARISGLNVRHIPDQFVLRMARGVRPRNCRVLWRGTDAVGVEFTGTSESAEDANLRRPRTQKRRADAAHRQGSELADEGVL
jgi:hypothetical protein